MCSSGLLAVVEFSPFGSGGSAGNLLLQGGGGLSEVGRGHFGTDYPTCF